MVLTDSEDIIWCGNHSPDGLKNSNQLDFNSEFDTYTLLPTTDRNRAKPLNTAWASGKHKQRQILAKPNQHAKPNLVN